MVNKTLGARASKYKFGARVAKYKWGARAVKYTSGTSVGKYKFGTRARGQGREIQIPIDFCIFQKRVKDQKLF